jgi:hypothetical protein
MLCGFEDFEEYHFGGAKACAFCGDSIQADLLILQCARRDSIGNTIDCVTTFDKVNGGLINADVGFQAGEENLPAARFFQFAAKFLAATTTEIGFIYRLVIGEQFCDFGDCGAKRRGDLLAPKYGDIKNFGGLDEDADIFEEGVFIVHQLGEFALNIDDNKTAIVLVKHIFMTPAKTTPTAGKAGAKYLFMTSDDDIQIDLNLVPCPFGGGYGVLVAGGQDRLGDGCQFGHRLLRRGEHFFVGHNPLDAVQHREIIRQFYATIGCVLSGNVGNLLRLYGRDGDILAEVIGAHNQCCRIEF